MNLRIAPVILALALAACEKKAEPKPPPAGAAPPAAATPRPEKAANGEPAAITVKHVLVGTQNRKKGNEARTPEQMEREALDILGRARAGEDFNALIRALSDDPGEGTYSMANTGIAKQGGEYERSGMVAAFGDVGFRLIVGEIGIAPHDAVKSPFGWHIIKRVK